LIISQAKVKKSISYIRKSWSISGTNPEDQFKKEIT
jgi:hypothetical protein